MNNNKDCVLVVDDEVDAREILATLVGEWGYAAIRAADGREALDYLNSHPAPRMMILDLCMPGMDGWRLLEMMRDDGRLGEVPVALLSSMIDCVRPEVLSATRWQFAKPVQTDELRAAIDEAGQLPPLKARPRTPPELVVEAALAREAAEETAETAGAILERMRAWSSAVAERTRRVGETGQ